MKKAEEEKPKVEVDVKVPTVETNDADGTGDDKGGVGSGDPYPPTTPPVPPAK